MQGRHHPPKNLTPFDRLLLITDQATYFLTPNRQPYALFNGSAAPLYSEPFRAWLLWQIQAACIQIPSAQMLAQLLRYHDSMLQLCDAAIHPVHTRVAPQPNGTLLVDLQASPNQIIEINQKHWTITIGNPAIFRHPERNLPLPTPGVSQAPIVPSLMQAFATDEPTAESLANWLALAMIPTITQPILVITGNARLEAARLLRNIIDPVIHPLLPMPVTENQLGQMAQANGVLAFDAGPHISEKRKAALSRMRRGVPVRIREINKGRDPLYETIHRPILIAADAPVEIDKNQINIEINQCHEAPLNGLLTALLNHVVKVLNYLESPRQAWRFENSAPPSLVAPAAEPCKPFT